MSFTNEEKVEYFKAELERIYDKKIREFTRLCLIYAPDYIFDNCPSSTSGKYHPLDELGADGTLIHIKKVFTMAYEIVKALNCENNRDIVLSACIVHDLRKYGIPGTPGFTGHSLKDHATLGVNLIDEVQEATQLLTEEQHKILRNCVGLHYGPWTDDVNWKKDMTSYTAEELTVFISDFVVSKRFIKTDFRR
jgi:hypothetical protein